jgi:hypothetical protein
MVASAKIPAQTFILCIFTRPVSRSTKSKDIVIQTATGPRALCSLALCRNCLKVRGVRDAVKPARVLAANGFGSDVSNWKRIEALRAEGKSVEWLTSNEGPDGLEEFEEQNQKALEVIGRLGGHESKAVWMELLETIQSFDSRISKKAAV